MNSNILHQLFDLTNKTIVLTGSAGFLGAHFANTLSSAGANVILVDIDEKRNKIIENQILRKFSTKPKSFHVDISEPSQIKELVQTIVKDYKTIDVLINNAQFLPKTHPKRDTPFEEYPLDLWDNCISVNLRGLFLCSKEIGNRMIKQGGGNIVNISSIYGLVGPDQRIYGKSRLNSPAFYAVTKGGMVNFTRYLASQWGQKNIRVNTLTLGGVYNNKYHKNSFVKKYSEKAILGRMAKIDDYDGALLFLTSDASSYMTGSNLIIDGGWTAW